METIDIVAQIKNKLDEIENTENARVILAVESGSRAWGFPSPDSDYDARFVYVRQFKDYLRVTPMRDVIEWQLDDVFDINGWDLQKALRLMYNSNPSLIEWCNSPIVYRENELAEPFRELAAEFFSPMKSIMHYASMARRNYNTYLQDDEVRLKKYFYVLRPVLAARWVAHNNSAPPMLFNELVRAELDPGIVPVVEELLSIKKETSEIGTGPKIPELDTYIKEQLKVIAEEEGKAENRKGDWNKLEEFFRSVVMKDY